MNKKTFIKLAIFSIFSIINTFAFAQNSAVPMQNNADASLSPLVGVWENKNRFVIVDENDNLNFVLKTFYGFYYDQAATLPANLDGRGWRCTRRP